MITPFPHFPFSHIRDYRKKPQFSQERLITIVDLATEERNKISDLVGYVSVLDALIRLPKGVYWSADDRYFLTLNGYMDGVEAYCDFHQGSNLYLREFIIFALSENATKQDRWDARGVVAHELGHLSPLNHRHKLIARTKSVDSSTSRRAAHDRKEGAFEDKLARKARNLDLEEEADCYSYAFLVPVTELNGTESFNDISAWYDVSPELAYNAAMLAKDYQRATFLRDAKQK